MVTENDQPRTIASVHNASMLMYLAGAEGPSRKPSYVWHSEFSQRVYEFYFRFAAALVESCSGLPIAVIYIGCDKDTISKSHGNLPALNVWIAEFVVGKKPFTPQEAVVPDVYHGHASYPDENEEAIWIITDDDIEPKIPLVNYVRKKAKGRANWFVVG